MAAISNSVVSNSYYGMLRRQNEYILMCSWASPFSSPEAVPLLFSPKNCDLFKGLIFRASAGNLYHILSQSDCQTWLWACTEWWEVHESWTSSVGPSQRSQFLCWLKGAWSLGKRLEHPIITLWSKRIQNGQHMAKKVHCLKVVV